MPRIVGRADDKTPHAFLFSNSPYGGKGFQKSMKRFLWLCFSLAVIGSLSAGDLYKVTAKRLNVRSAPSLASILGTLDRGTLIEVNQIINSSWAEFDYGGVKGYVDIHYLKFERKEDDLSVPDNSVTEAATPEEQAKDSVYVEGLELEETAPVDHTQTSPDCEIETLIYGPIGLDNRLRLYYGAAIGAGISSFKWYEGIANWRMSYSIDLFAQLEFKEQVAFIPRDYFIEFQLGFDGKGAAWYPMNYVHMRLFPFGYKYTLSEIRLTGQAGLYIGFPVSDLQLYNYPDSFAGNTQVGISAGIGADFRQFGLNLNVEYGITEVASTSVQLNNLAIFVAVSYKFGQLNR